MKIVLALVTHVPGYGMRIVLALVTYVPVRHEDRPRASQVHPGYAMKIALALATHSPGTP